MTEYEMVVGLEVHVELKTETKIFCSCSTRFGAPPNTQCCPVCMGLPGSLPVLNQKVVEYAIQAGMATSCTIAKYSKQDRKNYFYPDLPKAYQISQYDLPLCEKGSLEIETPAGSKKIGITRIHIEEDAGKLVHDKDGSYLDCNRCGVPLIEIVSEPDIRSAEEAVAYLQKLRAVMLFTGVSDCRMEEGSLRCDVNLSVHKPGEPFGTRTEMKNLNSFQFIQKAIQYEYQRQVEALERGEEIVQETRRFDEKTGKTFPMRRKEDANDYRYFPDPDLMPIEPPEEMVSALRAAMPPLPDQQKARYMKEMGLPAGEAELLTGSPGMMAYFEEAAACSAHPRQLAAFLTTQVFRLLDGGEEIPVSPAHLAALVEMIADGEISGTTARRVLAALWKQDGDPGEYVRCHDLMQLSDPVCLKPVVEEVVRENAGAVSDYRNGKTAALKALMGQVMGRTGGRANPEVAEKLLLELVQS